MKLEEVRMAVFGCCCLDVVCRLERALPGPGELVLLPEPPTFRIGGIALAAGVTAVRLGAQAGVLGLRGADIYGDKLAQLLRHEGINTDGYRRRKEMATSFTHVYVYPDGARCFPHHIGATAHVGPEALDQKTLHRAHVVFAGGIGITPGLHGENLARVFRSMTDSDRIIGIDTVHPGDLGPGEALPMIEPALALVTVLIMSAKEMVHFTGKTDPWQAVSFLRAKGAKCVILKMGPRGAIVSCEDSTLAIPAYAIQAKDTTGAGDATSGAILALLGSFGSLTLDNVVQAAKFGMKVGGYVALKGEGVQSVCDFETLSRFMDQQPLSTPLAERNC